MRNADVQETAVPKAADVARGIVDAAEAVSRIRIRREAVVGSRTCVTAHRPPLSVIENIECFSSELEGSSLFDRKMFEQSHVPVVKARISHRIAPCVAEGQPLRRDIGT